MAGLEELVAVLLSKRQELLDEVDAIDKAVAALRGAAVAEEAAPAVAPDATERADVTRVKPKRTLTDVHKQAIGEGRRKARHAKEVAAGKVREQLAGAPALAAAIDEAPRLVKRRI